MKSFVEERAVTLGKHIKENKTTLRSTAKYYGVSKSTVHTDVTARHLKLIPIYTVKCAMFWISIKHNDTFAEGLPHNKNTFWKTEICKNNNKDI